MPLLNLLCVLEVVTRKAFEPDNFTVNKSDEKNEFSENIIHDSQSLLYQENSLLLEHTLC